MTMKMKCSDEFFLWLLSDEYHSFPISYLQCKAVRIPNSSSKRKDSYAIFPINVESND